ncbi:hypothetical protein [Neorhizobium alkalisoli]|uniref:Uncharacterized protein n=1 Tax=Neorhizobium alkalisoli TaxID=528178 RepID=A0A561R8E4_9HYPH|nr:hypothetical protein [Neorhizobium alkalisoli]TWF58882.1 hypothetical protein FHW37_101686 [Neorhizobium alkalisoli]
MIINERAPNILLIVTPLAVTAVFLLDILGPASPYSSALYVPPHPAFHLGIFRSRRRLYRAGLLRDDDRRFCAVAK